MNNYYTFHLINIIQGVAIKYARYSENRGWDPLNNNTIYFSYTHMDIIYSMIQAESPLTILPKLQSFNVCAKFIFSDKTHILISRITKIYFKLINCFKICKKISFFYYFRLYSTTKRCNTTKSILGPHSTPISTIQ